MRASPVPTGSNRSQPVMFQEIPSIFEILPSYLRSPVEGSSSEILRLGHGFSGQAKIIDPRIQRAWNLYVLRYFPLGTGGNNENSDDCQVRRDARGRSVGRKRERRGARAGAA